MIHRYQTIINDYAEANRKFDGRLSMAARIAEKKFMAKMENDKKALEEGVGKKRADGITRCCRQRYQEHWFRQDLSLSLMLFSFLFFSF